MGSSLSDRIDLNAPAPTPDSAPGTLPVPAHEASTARAGHSRFVQRVRRRYGTELAWLNAGLPSREAIDALIDRLIESGRNLGGAMRVARQ